MSLRMNQLEGWLGVNGIDGRQWDCSKGEGQAVKAPNVPPAPCLAPSFDNSLLGCGRGLI